MLRNLQQTAPFGVWHISMKWRNINCTAYMSHFNENVSRCTKLWRCQDSSHYPIIFQDVTKQHINIHKQHSSGEKMWTSVKILARRPRSLTIAKWPSTTLETLSKLIIHWKIRMKSPQKIFALKANPRPTKVCHLRPTQKKELQKACVVIFWGFRTKGMKDKPSSFEGCRICVGDMPKKWKHLITPQK